MIETEAEAKEKAAEEYGGTASGSDRVPGSEAVAEDEASVASDETQAVAEVRRPGHTGRRVGRGGSRQYHLESRGGEPGPRAPSRNPWFQWDPTRHLPPKRWRRPLPCWRAGTRALKRAVSSCRRNRMASCGLPFWCRNRARMLFLEMNFSAAPNLRSFHFATARSSFWYLIRWRKAPVLPRVRPWLPRRISLSAPCSPMRWCRRGRLPPPMACRCCLVEQYRHRRPGKLAVRLSA